MEKPPIQSNTSGRDLPFVQFILLTVIPLVVIFLISVALTIRFNNAIMSHQKRLTTESVKNIVISQRGVVNIEILRLSLKTMANSTNHTVARNAYINAWGLLSDSSLDHNIESKETMYRLMRNVRKTWRERNLVDQNQQQIRTQWNDFQKEINIIFNLKKTMKDVNLTSLQFPPNILPLNPISEVELLGQLDSFDKVRIGLCSDNLSSSTNQKNSSLFSHCAKAQQQSILLRQAINKLIENKRSFQAKLALMDDDVIKLRRVYAEGETKALLADINRIHEFSDRSTPFFLLLALATISILAFLGLIYTTLFKPLKSIMHSMRTFQKENTLPGPQPRSLIREINLVVSWVLDFCHLTHREREKATHVASAYRKLLLRAHLDPLTGVANRQSLEEAISNEIKLQANTAIIMIDIDFFKRINDTKGHLFGDQILRSVGSVLKSSASKADAIYRYGGEEFCLIVPGITASTLIALAERLQKNIQQISLDTGEIEGQKASNPVTISLGLSSIVQFDGEKDLIMLIREADMALYQAKQSGRQQYACYVKLSGLKGD